MNCLPRLTFTQEDGKDKGKTTEKKYKEKFTMQREAEDGNSLEEMEGREQISLFVRKAAQKRVHSLPTCQEA